MIKIRRPAAVLAGLAAAILPATAVFAAPAATSKILYSSLAPPQGNIPSVGGEAYSFSEFGNEVTLTHSGQIGSVVVTMSSWGCGQSGGWSTDNCVTVPGTKFTEPITLNIYQAPATDPATQPDTVGSGLPGARILSVTKTFSIPYRPSANHAKCVGTSPYVGAGAWFDSALGQCFAGLMTNITFSLSSLHVTLPQNIVFGIAYNTSDDGYAPYGDSTTCHSTSQGCPYDSLNIGLSQDPTNLNTGSDPHPGGIYQNASSGGEYCDSGTAGTGTFRFDSPSTTECWSVYADTFAPYYIPAVEFIKAT
jgi:hypothetical protein